jgi:hypothetical protein
MGKRLIAAMKEVVDHVEGTGAALRFLLDLTTFVV